LTGFLDSNPIYAANIDPQLMSQLQAQNAAIGEPLSTKSVQTTSVQPTSSTFGNMYTGPSPYGSISSTSDPAAIAATIAAANQAANISTSNYSAPAATFGNAAVNSMVGDFTLGGPSSVLGGGGGAEGSSQSGPASATVNTTSPQTITTPLTISKAPSQIVDTGGGSSASGQTNTTATTAPTTLALDNGGGGGNIDTIGSGGIILPIIGDTTTSATNTASTTSTASPSFTRQYLGASDDPYHYGFGSERQYYGLVPAAAQGGYFDSEQYFADGGLVSPSPQPAQPLMSAQPTMAFTDGVGAIGNIAQPPGLSSQDSFGFDTDTASPMAPSPAAASPAVMSPLQNLSAKNVNGVPAPSPIAQNPNVGYALGKSPLSNL